MRKVIRFTEVEIIEEDNEVSISDEKSNRPTEKEEGYHGVFNRYGNSKEATNQALYETLFPNDYKEVMRRHDVKGLDDIDL